MKTISNELAKRLGHVVAGNLLYYATDVEANGDDELAGQLKAIAHRIDNGVASEADWMEALEQIEL
jgi:hypothetical protein